jgi:hypothetical protein
MVIFSTPQSIKDQQVSLLAIVETSLASTFFLWIYFRFGVVSHIVVSAAFAPFLLTRTPRYSALALKFSLGPTRILMSILHWCSLTTSDKPSLVGWLKLSYMIVLFFLETYFLFFALLIAKFLAFLVSILTAPVDAIGSIPENWRKVVLCTDTATLPELLPGAADLPGGTEMLRALPFDFGFWVPEAETSSAFTWVLAILVSLPILIPATLYRLSLKSTALIWSPLVWAFRPIRNEEDPFVFAKGVVSLSFFKISRTYSALIMVLFVAKLGFFLMWARLDEIFDKTPVRDLLITYLAPASMPLWHVTAMINACLTWIIFFRAEKYIHLAENGVSVSKAAMSSFFKGTFVARNIFSIYTALCTLYIAVRLATHFNAPGLDFLLVPW